MKICIESDGTSMGTKVMTETGEVIKGVKNIFWHIGVDGTSCADITIDAVPLTLTVQGKAEVDLERLQGAFDTVTVTDSQKRFTWKLPGVGEE